MIEGWEALEAAPAPETPELARDYVRAFSSNAGANVLQDICKRSISRQMPPGCSDADMREHLGACRLAWHIINMMERGRT